MQTHKLYQRWLAVAADRSTDLALHDFVSGKSWTFADLAADADARPPSGEVITASGLSAELILETLRGWRDGAIVCPLEGKAPPEAWFDQIPDGVAHVKLSGGSAPTERALLFTADPLEADADAIVAAMGLRPDWPNLGVVSMAHSYGFSNLVLPLLLHGIPLIWLGDSFPNAVEEALKEFGPVTLPAVPVLWKTWLKAGILDFSRIQLAISAGAPLPLALEQEVFQVCGLKIHNFYGASECGGIAYDDSDLPREDAHQAGRLFPGVSLETENAGLTIQSEAVANWVLTGDGVLTLLNGACSLEDQGSISGNRMFRFRELRRDLINVAGRKVTPAVVERELESIPGVEFAIVFGIQSRDRLRNEQVGACIVAEEGLDLNQLRTRLRLNLLNYEVPVRIWKWAEITSREASEMRREDWRKLFGKDLPTREALELKVSNS